VPTEHTETIQALAGMISISLFAERFAEERKRRRQTGTREA
jgi:hypothetical protein